MIWNTYDRDWDHLNGQFKSKVWDTVSGLPPEQLKEGVLKLAENLGSKGYNHPKIKAEAYNFVLGNAQLEIDTNDWFCSNINHAGALRVLRGLWSEELMNGILSEKYRRAQLASQTGCFSANPDFCHTGFDWESLLSLGIPGLLDRLREARKNKREDTDSFYESSELALLAVKKLALRISKHTAALAENAGDEQERMLLVSESLKAIAERAPETTLEALQLVQLFYMVGDEMEVDAIDAMGGQDRLYYRFYKSDLNSGRFSREQIKELFKYYLTNIGMAADRYSSFLGHSFHVGGRYADGSDAVNPLTYVIVEAFSESKIYTPKLSIRMYRGTSESFITYITTKMRDENLHCVLCNDDIAIPALIKVGLSPEDAAEYAPVGCYEPVAVGKEIGCTGWPGNNISKSVELALHNGIDPLTMQRVGIETGAIESFKDYTQIVSAVKDQMEFQIRTAIDIQKSYEEKYLEFSPTPLLSSTYTECVEKGIDAYHGGAKYNNSAAGISGFGELVDAMLGIKKLVYEYKAVSLPDLVNIIDRNWEGNEILRMKALSLPEKWGNNLEEPDTLGREFCDFAAGIINSSLNARGGRYKMSNISITLSMRKWGDKLGALPSGRKAHEFIPKNLGPNEGMDRSGVTALINSVTKLDFTEIPNGSVLDIMLHPTAVSGEDGIIAFSSLFRSYFTQGGFGIQFNIFDVKTLRDAQEHPEKYPTMQIRVCGWNVYFINLARDEQDLFIREAERKQSA
jgi:formate C-acetyltransferase